MAWRQGFRFFSSSSESYSTSSLEVEEHQQFFQHYPAPASTHRLSNPSSAAHQSARGFLNRYNGKKQQPEYMYERVTNHVAVENYTTSHVQPSPHPAPTRFEPQHQYKPGSQPGAHPSADYIQPSGDVIDSNQAAKSYGGLVVTEYYPNPRTKVVRKAYY